MKSVEFTEKLEIRMSKLETNSNIEKRRTTGLKPEGQEST